MLPWPCWRLEIPCSELNRSKRAELVGRKVEKG